MSEVWVVVRTSHTEDSGSTASSSSVAGVFSTEGGARKSCESRDTCNGWVEFDVQGPFSVDG